MSDLPKSVGEHPNFPKVAPHVSMDSDPGGRPRFGLRSKAPENVCELALSMRVVCASCGAPIQPFRDRSAPKKRGAPTKNIYMSVSCSPDDKKGCCKGAASKQAIEKFESDLFEQLSENERVEG